MNREAFYKSEGWDKLAATIAKYDDGEDIIDDLETLEDYIKHIRADRDALRKALRNLLLSADCSWEDNNQGHDWPEACEQARAALAKWLRHRIMEANLNPGSQNP